MRGNDKVVVTLEDRGHFRGLGAGFDGFRKHDVSLSLMLTPGSGVPGDEFEIAVHHFLVADGFEHGQTFVHA